MPSETKKVEIVPIKGDPPQGFTEVALRSTYCTTGISAPAAAETLGRLAVFASLFLEGEGSSLVPIVMRLLLIDAGAVLECLQRRNARHEIRYESARLGAAGWVASVGCIRIDPIEWHRARERVRGRRDVIEGNSLSGGRFVPLRRRYVLSPKPSRTALPTGRYCNIGDR